MSVFINICCSRCGRELYRPLNVSECRERRVLYYPGLYVVNDNGQEELCEKCFEVWQKPEKSCVTCSKLYLDCDKVTCTLNDHAHWTPKKPEEKWIPIADAIPEEMERLREEAYGERKDPWGANKENKTE